MNDLLVQGTTAFLPTKGISFSSGSINDQFGVQIPGTVQVLDIAVQGNRALVVGSSQGMRSPFNGLGEIGLAGNLTLSMLDVTDPQNPLLLGTTKVTSVEFPKGSAVHVVQAVSLGNGRFTVGGVKSASEGPVLVVVDGTDPAKLSPRNLPVPALLDGLAVSDAGNDKLAAGIGFDLLIGGLGKDKLTGGTNGNSLLIGGQTPHDASDTALLGLLSEWSRRVGNAPAPLADRIAKLTTGGGLNGAATLTTATLIDDGVLDTLKGFTGDNWFFKQKKDKLSPKNPPGILQG